MGWTITLKGLEGRPGLNPESGVKNLQRIWPTYTETNDPYMKGNISIPAHRQLAIPVHYWHVLQVHDWSYNLWVTASSPNHPGGRCDRSQRDGQGRKPLAQHRRRWTFSILNTWFFSFFFRFFCCSVDLFRYATRKGRLQCSFYPAPMCSFQVLFVPPSTWTECNFAATCS